MIPELMRHPLRMAWILGAFALLGTALLALIFEVTRDNIAASEQRAKLALVGQILPASSYDNDLLHDTLILAPDARLGTTEATVAYRARMAGQPVAIVLEAVAPDGYAGRIRLIIAIKENGELSGVRVVAHKETPGLGDYIEVAKSPWIRQFDGASLENTESRAWKVIKDGGRFEYLSGATITPRAVVKAVHKALGYYTENRERMFAP